MSEWAAKRFWKKANFRAVAEGFAIELDGRGVRTPAKRSLVVPTHAMGEAIAAEWDAQGEKIDPQSMPFTRAANAALDKVATQQAEVAALIADYGGSDLLCYRAAHPDRLIQRQAAAWDPLVKWGEDRFGVSLTLAEGVMHVQQPKATTDVFSKIVAQQGPFSLTALHDLVSLTGSLVMGLAAQQGAFGISDLWAASTIDESFQFEEWGDDEEAFKALEIKAEAFASAAKFQQLLGMQSYTS